MTPGETSNKNGNFTHTHPHVLKYYNITKSNSKLSWPRSVWFLLLLVILGSKPRTLSTPVNCSPGFWDKVSLCSPGMVILPQPPECWDGRRAPPHPIFAPSSVTQDPVSSSTKGTWKRSGHRTSTSLRLLSHYS